MGSVSIAVRKTTISLADGRELSYFDSGAPARRDEPDRRGLPPGRPESQLRYDPLRRTWVMYAGHRQDRTHLPTAADCPLCPSTDSRATEIPAHDYEVVVFENRFPALTQAAAGLGLGDAAGEPDELLATAVTAELHHRIYDGKLQGLQLLVNPGAPGSRSPWVTR